MYIYLSIYIYKMIILIMIIITNIYISIHHLPEVRGDVPGIHQLGQRDGAAVVLARDNNCLNNYYT